MRRLAMAKYDYDSTLAMLKEIGQEHILKFYGELDADRKASLLEQIHDADLSVVRLAENRDAISFVARANPRVISNSSASHSISK